MKTTKALALSLAWILITLFALSWVLYSEARMDKIYKNAFGIDANPKALLNKADELMTQAHEAKTLESLSDLKFQALQFQVRHFVAASADSVRRQMVRRLWTFWTIATFVPIVILWCGVATRRDPSSLPFVATTASPA